MPQEEQEGLIWSKNSWLCSFLHRRHTDAKHRLSCGNQAKRRADNQGVLNEFFRDGRRVSASPSVSPLWVLITCDANSYDCNVILSNETKRLKSNRQKHGCWCICSLYATVLD